MNELNKHTADCCDAAESLVSELFDAISCCASEENLLAAFLLEGLQSKAAAILEDLRLINEAARKEQKLCPVGFCRRIQDGTAMPMREVTVKDLPDKP